MKLACNEYREQLPSTNRRAGASVVGGVSEIGAMNVRELDLDRLGQSNISEIKTRLLAEIARAMAAVIGPDEPIADLFSGTAVVGRRLARRNAVIGVDVQGYAAILGRRHASRWRARSR